MENVNEVEPIIHPKDTKTGIKYRLLPMTRSMIAEILSPEESASSKNHQVPLAFP